MNKKILTVLVVLIGAALLGWVEYSTLTKKPVAETAEWKTYTNTQYGFEIKLPNDWHVEEHMYLNGNSVAFDSPENYKLVEEGKKRVDSEGSPSNITFVYYDNIVTQAKNESIILSSGSLEEYVKLNQYDFFNTQKINFAGQVAFRGTEAGLFSIDAIWMTKNNHFYKIWLESDIGMSDELSAQILSTFKFREPSKPTPSGWGTYTDTDYGFTMQYPAGDPLLVLDAAEASHIGFIPICDYTYSAIACFAYDPKLFPGTNFEGAGLSINLARDPTNGKIITTQKSCQEFMNLRGSTDDARVINDISFNTSQSGEAATGHTSNDYYYTTFANDYCFDLIIRIDTFNNYEPNTFKEFSSEMNDQVLGKLSDILFTFKFTK